MNKLIERHATTLRDLKKRNSTKPEEPRESIEEDETMEDTTEEE